MSLIWDQLHQSGPTKSEEAVVPAPRAADRRSSSRANVYVPLFVYGYTATEEPFHEETNTLEVNVNGGLLHLGANVRRGQKLLVVNRMTKEEQECYVVTLAKRPKQAEARVGVAFAKSAPGFWRSRR